MPKKKNALPSGSIRIQVYVGKRADGSRRYESFTAPTREQANAEAAAFRLKVKQMTALGIDVDDIPRDGLEIKPRDTIEGYLIRYVDSCETAGYSPSTIRSYNDLIRIRYRPFIKLPVHSLTIGMVQDYVNRRAKEGASPQTIRNEISLLSASLKTVRPEICMRALKLPKQSFREIQIPTTQEVQQIITAAKGTELYVPVLLASLMGLRRSEIAALTWQDIDLKRRTLHVHAALVLGSDGLTRKGPKSRAGDRVLNIPANVARALAATRGTDPRVTQLAPKNISDRFFYLLGRLRLPHYRFHALRHYHASVMISVGAPDKYIQADMGHSTMEMVRRVYGHVMADKQQEINAGMEEKASAFSL